MSQSQSPRAPLGMGMTVFVVMLATMAPALAALNYLQDGEIDDLQRRLRASQASERTAWGKVYDLQWGEEERENDERSALQLKVWNLETQLSKCQNQ